MCFAGWGGVREGWRTGAPGMTPRQSICCYLMKPTSLLARLTRDLMLLRALTALA